jgi:DNA-binding NarL/FixJ family response regulator
MTKVALVDDHALLRNGLAAVINNSDGYQVVFEADNGKHFIECLKNNPRPDVLLLDITMPEMDGFETAEWIKNNAPEIKILVLSMMDDDKSIIRMLKYGARGYILKDSKPEVLRSALRDITEKGFFFNELVSGRLVHIASQADGDKNGEPALSEKETDFLKLCCTEKSYKEIADAMHITPRAVEALRSNLFEKLQTLSRVGLVMYAIRNGIAKI